MCEPHVESSFGTIWQDQIAAFGALTGSATLPW
jgi:hypothetical protein